MKKTLLALLLPATLTAAAADLHINNQDYAVDTLVVKHPVGPGITYAYYRLPGRPLDIFVLETDLSNPYIHMEVWNGGQAAVASETPSHVGQRYKDAGTDVVAVHNGDFYTTNLGEVGISRMGLIGGGDCIFNPTGNPLLCMDAAGNPVIDYVQWAGQVTRQDGTVNRLHTVNQLRLEWEPASHPYQLSLYTPAFGTRMHANSTGGKVAVLRHCASNAFPVNTPIEFEITDIIDNPGQAEIPADGALLHGVNSAADFLAAAAPGQKITVMLGVTLPSYPDFKNITEGIGGSGHIILRDGNITNINNPDCHPRTFMGISRDNRTLYSVVVDGRTGSSAGIDLDDEGRVLQWLGAWHGINLDGGGSSCMVVNDKIRNHNSDGTERAVGNGVIFYSIAPESPSVTDIMLEPSDWRLPAGATVSPRVYGFNRYGLLVDKDVAHITLSCDETLGRITDGGRTLVVSPDATGSTLTATTADGLTHRVDVSVSVQPASAIVTDYIVDNRKPYDLKLAAKVGAQTYKIETGTITWTSSNPQVAAVTDGRVTGGINGTAILTGTGVHFDGSVTVTTENPDGTDRSLFHGLTAEDLTLKQTGGTGLTATPAGNGIDLTYTGNGTARGAYIQVSPATGPFVSYGLPDAVAITINPGDAEVQQISMNYTDHMGNRGTMSFTTKGVEPNTVTTIVKPLADIIDVTDNASYPLTLNALRLTMGTSAKGTQYTISVPELKYIYNYTEGVHDIKADGGTPTRTDNTLYRLDGSPAPANPAPGIYIDADGTKTLKR